LLGLGVPSWKKGFLPGKNQFLPMGREEIPFFQEETQPCLMWPIKTPPCWREVVKGCSWGSGSHTIAVVALLHWKGLAALP